MDFSPFASSVDFVSSRRLGLFFVPPGRLRRLAVVLAAAAERRVQADPAREQRAPLLNEQLLGVEQIALRIQHFQERRAAAVVSWLTTNAVIGAERLRAKGYGESRPVAMNTNPDGSDNPEGRQKNRRVDVVIPRK